VHRVEDFCSLWGSTNGLPMLGLISAAVAGVLRWRAGVALL
jgi:hypothetical protein